MPMYSFVQLWAVYSFSFVILYECWWKQKLCNSDPIMKPKHQRENFLHCEWIVNRSMWIKIGNIKCRLVAHFALWRILCRIHTVDIIFIAFRDHSLKNHLKLYYIWFYLQLFLHKSYEKINRNLLNGRARFFPLVYVRMLVIAFFYKAITPITNWYGKFFNECPNKIDVIKSKIVLHIIMP